MVEEIFSFTQADKSLVYSVEEGNVFAGPGIYESEEDTTRRMKEDLLIRDNYAVVKNRIRAAESSEIDKIIAWS